MGKRKASEIWPHGIHSGLKVCARCRAELPFTSFALKAAALDGRMPYCRTCRRECAMRGQSSRYRIGEMSLPQFCFHTLMALRGVALEFCGGREVARRDEALLSPDFRDPKTGTLYKVYGTRQGFSANRERLDAFRRAHPETELIVVHPDGTPITSRETEGDPPAREEVAV